MTHSDQAFRSLPEEVARLREEVTAVRGVLKELSTRLSQIERHAKRVLTPPRPPRTGPSGAARTRPPQAPTMDAASVLHVFEELTALWRAEGGAPVAARLEALSLPDLRLMAQQLGLSMGSRPAKGGLVSGIVGRINESLLLSSNRNVTAPKSSEGTKEGR